MSWKQYLKSKWMRFGVPVLALALTAFATYEYVSPVSAVAAAAPMPAPAAPALSDSSVSPLLAMDQAMETLAARVTPAVVNVAVTSRTKTDLSSQGQIPDEIQRFFGESSPFGQFHMQPQQPQIEHGIGSGVVISPDGYIVTNNHVVEGAQDIRVTTSNRRVMKAKLVGTDPLTDLAVLKVDATNMPSVPWGDSSEVRQGQTVLAFGNPFGLRFTETRGIVSAINRANPDSSDPRKPGEFIQTDAAINQGNSGGPLVNVRGEVVGINTFLISPSGSFAGMGFAIPSQIVKPTVDTLIRYGKVTHSHIGVGITDVTPENAKFFDDSNASGAVITEVEPDSPGARAGLHIGDVITQLDGHKVADAGELQAQITEKSPGTKIELGILRDGKSMTLPVTLEEINGHGAESATAGSGQGKMHWGLGLADLTPDTRQQIQAPQSVHGAVIENVKPGSSADNAGLQPGDVILEVDRHKVESASDVQKELGSVPKGQDALVLVWSHGGNTFRVLHSPEGA